ncbi:hypothetical protein EXO80_25655 [Salmonella enterica]|nr:hypothetical protein [Salmonella enterica]ECH1726034.1 hypothetical protein [Salmonella enterica]
MLIIRLRTRCNRHYSSHENPPILSGFFVDYFTLRDRVKTMQKQLEATQQYISEQCMQ